MILMRIEPGLTQIERKAIYVGKRTSEVSFVRRTQEVTIYYGKNSRAQVLVDTRFAKLPGDKPTLHTDIGYVGPSATHEEMVPLERQRELLQMTASQRIPCKSCPLAERSECGLDIMGVRSHNTDSAIFDPCSQKILGLSYAIELPEGTQASDVKCIQP
jgi:hypothetical protein